MFKRVIVEDWALIIPYISFFIFLTVFILICIRALRMEKARRTYLASLPLDDHTENPNL